MSDSAKYDLLPFLHASEIATDSLHFEYIVMPKWLYESFFGTSVCPRCYVNSLFRLLHLTKNVNTQDFDALNLKRHLHEYEYATSNNL